MFGIFDKEWFYDNNPRLYLNYLVQKMLQYVGNRYVSLKSNEKPNCPQSSFKINCFETK